MFHDDLLNVDLEAKNIITVFLLSPPLLSHIWTIRLVQIQRKPNTNPTAPTTVPTAPLLRATRPRTPGSLRNGASEPMSHSQDAAVHVFAHDKQRGKFNGLSLW